MENNQKKTAPFRKELKIAVLIDQLLPGGVQKTAIEEVQWLNSFGFEAKLLILMRKGFEKKTKHILGKTPHEFLSDRYPKIFQKSFKLPIFNFLSTSHLISPVLAPFKINRKEFDLLISHGTTTSLTTWSLSKFKHIPYFAVIHDPMVYILDKVYSHTPLKHLFLFLKPLSSFLERQFTKSSNLCLIDSTVHAKFLKTKYKVSPTILHLGIKPPRKIPPKRGDAILALGRWSLEKNPTFLLKILDHLQQAELIIAGDWTSIKDLETFRKIVRQKKLKSKVTIIPRYSEKELNNICRRGRLWVHPHFEAFSLSALEAAAHGLPIVIPQNSGVTEIFKKNIHGFFPKKISISEYLKAITPLLNNERLAFQMGFTAAKIAGKYTPQIRAHKLAKMINKLFYPQKIRLLALETGHVTGSLIAGGDRLLEEMAKKLQTDLSITLVISKLGQKHWEKSGLKVTYHTLHPNKFDKYSGPFGVFINYLLRSWESYFILNKITKNSQSEVLYSSTGIFPDVLPIYLIKLTNPRIRWIARVHHLLMSPFKRPGRFWVNLGSSILEKISLFAIKRRADSILVLNSKLKSDLINRGFAENKTVILEGGVDFQAIQKMQSPKTKKYDAVFLGRIHYTKGIFDLAPIWTEVTKTIPSAKLAIIGTGHPEIVLSLKKQIEQAKLQKNIFLLGYLSQERVRKTLKKSKIFLFTDHEAGFGLAATEAMAAGCPVVGYDIGILGNVFEKGYQTVPLNNIKSFAQSVTRLLEDERLSKKLSKEAILESAKFDWQITSKSFARILHSQLND